MVLQVAYPARVAGHDLDGGMSIRACCAMPGTDLVYGATRLQRGSSLWTYGTTKKYFLRCKATRQLCDAQY
eukprot:1584237-Rhodomonas_salina.1